MYKNALGFSSSGIFFHEEGVGRIIIKGMATLTGNVVG